MFLPFGVEIQNLGLSSFGLDVHCPDTLFHSKYETAKIEMWFHQTSLTKQTIFCFANRVSHKRNCIASEDNQVNLLSEHDFTLTQLGHLHRVVVPGLKKSFLQNSLRVSNYFH